MDVLARWKAWLPLVAVATLSVVAVAAGTFLPVAFASDQGETRELVIDAHKFAYSPSRINVNQGDTVILRLNADDVSHGLYVDGYDLETHANPTVPGVPAEEGVLKFVADTPGKFRFRCSITCGNLHPFMIGELNVESGTPGTNAPFVGAAAAALFVGIGGVIYGWKSGRLNDGSSS